MAKKNKDNFVGVRMTDEEMQVLETLRKAYSEQLGTDMSASMILRAGLTALYKQAAQQKK